MITKFSLKSSLKSGYGGYGLTTPEKEVLDLLTKEYLTVKQISFRRHTSVQATYRIVKKLKQIGVLTSTNETDIKSDPTTNILNLIRLHAQHFVIRILFKDYHYSEHLHNCNTMFLDGNTVTLHKDSINVYSGQSFFGKDANLATANSFEYWNRFIKKLENDLHVILLKPRSQNIRLVSQHYAEINNELSTDCKANNVKIHVHSTADGKLWFLTDNSLGFHEAETVHPTTAQVDMQDVVAPFFNDLRDHSGNLVLPSELQDCLYATIDYLKSVTNRVNELNAALVNLHHRLIKLESTPTHCIRGNQND